MKAKLVYDGENLIVPEEMGKPKKGQLEGTPREKVAELCGRVCYDSLGKGRPSVDYHKHIHEVGHYSVYEHTPITVAIKIDIKSVVWYNDILKYIYSLINRPGIYIWPESVDNFVYLRITANFRSIIEWDKFSNIECYDLNTFYYDVGNALKYYGHKVAPQIVNEPKDFDINIEYVGLCNPIHEQEKWITLFMAGSRGFSHEQVRHGDFTAISQRSTRYVNESDSSWILHPLIQSYLVEHHQGLIQDVVEATQLHCQESYDHLVAELEPWLINKGIDKFSARKQARGAARGFLGNALETEMMFSASVSQWKHMISMRATKYADAEIRQIYTEGVIPALQQSRYAEDFNYDIRPSDDGIGHVAVNLSEDKSNG